VSLCARTIRIGPRRAFTLVEALVATALLAIVAAACMPLLRAAAGGSDLSDGRPSGGGRMDRSLLVALAERVARKPSAFGIDGSTSGSLAVAWPEDVKAEAPNVGEWPDVEVDVLRPDPVTEDDMKSGAQTEDRWIVVRAGGESVARWCAVPRAANGSGRRPRRAARKRMRLASVTRIRAEPRRGMTLVETLVAIAITSALATAVFAWTTTAARVAHEVSARASRDATAEAVLRSISDDLLSRDVEPTNRAAGRRPVIVEGGVLTVRTRSSLAGGSNGPAGNAAASSGPVVRRYGITEGTGELRVQDTRPDGSQGESVLARDVTLWRVSLDARGESLEVEIAVSDGAPLSRRFTVP
jgi:prepilin-type N-terminal cleavage/methylation domain-containing protein